MIINRRVKYRNTSDYLEMMRKYRHSSFGRHRPHHATVTERPEAWNNSPASSINKSGRPKKGFARRGGACVAYKGVERRTRDARKSATSAHRLSRQARQLKAENYRAKISSSSHHHHRQSARLRRLHALRA